MSKSLANRLPVLPNANKDELVQSFVKSQQRNASCYAAEGKTFQASWNGLQMDQTCTPGMLDSQLNRNEEVSGFQTPVLKPRVLREPLATQADDKKQKRSDHTTKESAARHLSSQVKGCEKLHVRPSQETRISNEVEDKQVENRACETNMMKPKEGERSKGHPRKVPVTSEPRLAKDQKKRRPCEHSDDGNVDRLVERRARKRAKRNLLNPDENAMPSAKPKTKKQTKLPAGLAILHGFSATNIGQKRITLQPGTLGMFGKGKASANTKVAKKSGKQAPALHIFSEARFLNPQTSKVPTAESRSEFSATPVARKRPRNEPSPESEKSQELDEGTVVPTHRDSLNEVLEGRSSESAVWDIEDESEILASDTKSLVVTSVQASDVVLDVGNRPWAGQGVVLETLVPGNSTTEDKVEEDYSSLCPSNSASQPPRRRTSPKLLDPELLCSRFFPLPANLQARRTLGPDQTKEDVSAVAIAEEDPDTPAQPTLVEENASQPPGSCFAHSLVSETQEAVSDQAQQSICGSLNSLEEAFKLCEADDHLLDIGRSINFDSTEVASGCGSSQYVSQNDGYQELEQFEEEVGSFYGEDFMFEVDSEITCRSQNEFMMEETDETELQFYTELYTLTEVGCDEDFYEITSDHTEEEEWQQPYHQQTLNYCSEVDASVCGIDSDDLFLSPLVEATSDSSDSGADYTFNQGRALLLGLAVSNPRTQRRETDSKTNSAEEEVAKHIKGHWLPQRP